MDLHEHVYIARLLILGGLAQTEGQALGLIHRGQVMIERWTIGIAEATLPRWVLRGVTITVGDRSIRISDDGSKILRSEMTLL